MMLERLRLFGDVVGLATFSAAFLLLASLPASRERRPDPTAKWLMAFSTALFILITGSAVATDLGVRSAIEPLTAYLETLWPVMAVGVVFSSYAAQQYSDIVRTRTALQQSHDLLMDIVDGAPAGIMFLDPAGRIAFANDAAKKTLDLVEEPGSGSFTGAGCTLRYAEGTELGELAILVSADPYDAERTTLECPNGRSIDLLVSGRPMWDATDKLGGVVVTFETVRGTLNCDAVQ